MKKLLFVIALIFIVDGTYNTAYGQSTGNLRIIIVRHGEKDDDGDNLNCRGFSRAMQLPKVMVGKFGKPSTIYVPSVDAKKSTSHARMFQTASPLAIKYGLPINTKFAVDDYSSLAENLQSKSGTVLVVWEHKVMDNLLRALGLKTKGMKWGDDDFDSIWIVTYKNGKPQLTTDKEGITPVNNCQF